MKNDLKYQNAFLLCDFVGILLLKKYNRKSEEGGQKKKNLKKYAFIVIEEKNWSCFSSSKGKNWSVYQKNFLNWLKNAYFRDYKQSQVFF